MTSFLALFSSIYKCYYILLHCLYLLVWHVLFWRHSRHVFKAILLCLPLMLCCWSSCCLKFLVSYECLEDVELGVYVYFKMSEKQFFFGQSEKQFNIYFILLLSCDGKRKHLEMHVHHCWFTFTSLSYLVYNASSL